MGILAGILPTPQGLPTNITPNQGGLSNFGGRIMDNLPYGGGAVYNVLNSLVHLAQGTAGEHGPSPSIIGRIMQYINPGYDQGAGATAQLPTTPATNNPPMYGGLVPGITGQQATQNTPAPGISPYIQQLYNSGRFPGTVPFTGTLAQAMFPGSRIGPSNPVGLTADDLRNLQGLGSIQGSVQGQPPQDAWNAFLSRVHP